MSKQVESAEIIELESRGPEDKPAIYFLPDGRKVTIGINVLDFFSQLQELPASTKISMMRLTAEEMNDFIKEQLSTKKRLLMKTLKKEWRWKETGEIVTELLIEHQWIKQTEMLRIMSRKKLPLELMNKWLELFYGERTEVYEQIQ